jgi:aminomethyltransferase
MKSTALSQAHRDLGARMASYADWNMPIQYPFGPAAEAKACRTGVGLFDVSHMGEIRVTGADALSFVQFISTNDASRLNPGKAQYSLLLTPEGFVVDDIIVYRLAEFDFMIVLNAGCKDKDIAWIFEKTQLFKDVSVIDISDETSLIAVQGPNAVEMVNKLSDSNLDDLDRFCFKKAVTAGVSVIASRTGYTGDDGFELFCDWNDALKLWNALVEAGGAPCGLASRDVLRIEAAYSLYGHEIDQETSPLEGGVGWAIKTKKDLFIGKDAVLAVKKAGIKRTVAGLKVAKEARGIPREGCDVYAEGIEEPVGKVTSGTISPMLGYGIAIAKVSPEWKIPGKELTIDIRGRRVAVETVSLPFYRNGV